MEPELPKCACTDLYRKSRQVDARTDDSLVMVGIHTDRVGFQVESVLAILDLLQLILVQVWPSPDPSVDDVRETLPSSNLSRIAVSKVSLIQPWPDQPVTVHREFSELLHI